MYRAIIDFSKSMMLLVFAVLTGVLMLLLVQSPSPALAQDETATPEPTQEPAQFDLPITRDVTYVVQPGDTLDQIAAAFDVRLACLREKNDMRPADILAAGQDLLISVDCPAYDGLTEVTSPRTNAPGRTGEDGSYVVRPNDTPDTIAQALNISTVALMQANDLKFGRDLKAGTVLTIPQDAPEYGTYPAINSSANQTTRSRLDSGEIKGTTYVFQPNDTLDTVGQKLNVSVEALKAASGIENPSAILPGTLIVIPEGAPPYGIFPAGEPAGSQVAQGKEYVIQPQDTIDHISALFNVDTQCVLEANGIENPKQILAGQTIGIPADCPAYSGYDFVPGFTPTPFTRQSETVEPTGTPENGEGGN